MTHTKHHPDHEQQQKGNEPYWKRAHHDWKFWVALSLMLTSMLIYIVTLDESVQPETKNSQQVKQPLP